MSKRLLRDIFVYLALSAFIIISIILSGIYGTLSIFDNFKYFTNFAIFLLSGNTIKIIIGIVFLILSFLVPIMYFIYRIKKEERFHFRFIALIIYLSLLLIDLIIKTLFKKINIESYWIMNVLLTIVFFVAVFLEIYYFALFKNDGGATCISGVGRGLIILTIIQNIFSISYLINYNVEQQIKITPKYDISWVTVIIVTIISIILLQSIVMYFEERNHLNLEQKKSRLVFIKIFSFMLFIAIIINIIVKLLCAFNYVFEDLYYYSYVDILKITLPLFIYFATVVSIKKLELQSGSAQRSAVRR